MKVNLKKNINYMSVTVILYQHFRASSSMLTWGGGATCPAYVFIFVSSTKKRSQIGSLVKSQKVPVESIASILTRAPMVGGGGRNAPSSFLTIAQKRNKISPPNLTYSSQHQLYIPRQKEFSKALIGQP